MQTQEQSDIDFSTKFCVRRIQPEVETLTRLPFMPLSDRKGNPFNTLQRKWQIIAFILVMKKKTCQLVVEMIEGPE